MFCLHIYLCMAYVPGALVGQTATSDHLELELQIVVIHYVGAGNQAQVFCKSKCSKPLSHLLKSSVCWPNFWPNLLQHILVTQQDSAWRGCYSGYQHCAYMADVGIVHQGLLGSGPASK